MSCSKTGIPQELDKITSSIFCKRSLLQYHICINFGIYHPFGMSFAY